MKTFKKISAAFLALTVVLSSAQLCFAADSAKYTAIKAYVDAIKPSGEIVVNALIDTIKVGTVADNLTAADKRVNKGAVLVYESTLDMQGVREKYSYLTGLMNDLAQVDAAIKGYVDESAVSGEFTIDITYDTALDVSALTEDAFVNLNSDIFDAAGITKTPGSGTYKISVKLAAGKKVTDITADKLTDITYRVNGVKAPEADGTYSVAVSMSGAVDFSIDSQKYATIKFTSPETKRIVTISSSNGVLGNPESAKPVTDRTVSFNTNGGSDISDITVENGGTISAPADPVREGYTFDGWYADKELTEEYDFGSAVTENITLYAKWNKNEPEVPSAIVGGNVIGELPVKDDNTIDLPELGEPEREGFIFSGWYTDEELTQKVTEETVIEDGHLYGKWINGTVPELLNGDDHIAYITGYPDGTVQPEQNITRQEVAMIIYRLMTQAAREQHAGAQAGFVDMHKDMWSYEAVSVVAAAGLIKGYDGNIFEPAREITRAEFAAMLSRLYSAADMSYAKDFNDIKGHWAEEDIKKLSALECIDGYEDGSFKPEQKITRAEAIAIINRILVRYAHADGILDITNIWPDNNADKWYYYPVLEAGHEHDYDRAEDKYNENWK